MYSELLLKTIFLENVFGLSISEIFQVSHPTPENKLNLRRRQHPTYQTSTKLNTSYNILLGKPKLNVLRAIVSIPHLAMKFPSSHGEIGIVKADKEDAHECYVKSYNMVREKNNKASTTSINTVSASWANLDP
ncbi:hypothetical protein JHK86_006901 [Glycine max]|nr:hypothetical protein JHK86_006901 [Glycine max]